MSRPRVLDETKRREVCALLTAGMTLGSAAEYVGCSVKTIRRERDGDEDFDLEVRRAKMAARLGPLQAVRRAAATHWRAAAWLVERQERRDEKLRAARRQRVELERVVREVKEVVRREVESLPQQWAIEDQIDQIAAGREPSGAGDALPGLRGFQRAADAVRGGHEEASAAKSNRASAVPSPVPEALRELAERLAAADDKQAPGVPSSDVDAPERTKPAEVTPPRDAAETMEEALNGDERPTRGMGFVPSLRVFGQNEWDREDECTAACSRTKPLPEREGMVCWSGDGSRGSRTGG